MECTKCGADNSAHLTLCEYCGAALPLPAQTATYAFPGLRDAQPFVAAQLAKPTASRSGWLDMSPYYQAAFTELDRSGGSYLFHWNWAAFFGGGLWYLVKGMWLHFALITVFWLFCILNDAPVGMLIIMLYAGGFGTYHYYKHKLGQRTGD
jgi:hypothetical protein